MGRLISTLIKFKHTAANKIQSMYKLSLCLYDNLVYMAQNICHQKNLRAMLLGCKVDSTFSLTL
jgi:hypothetical protein